MQHGAMSAICDGQLSPPVPINGTDEISSMEAMIEFFVREGETSASGQGLLTTAENVTDLQLYGFYSDLTQKIYLDEQWSASSISNVSILVHKMAHHLQFMSNIGYACKEERERVAYEAQARWLQQSGLDLKTAFELDPTTLLLRTRCMH